MTHFKPFFLNHSPMKTTKAFGLAGEVEGGLPPHKGRAIAPPITWAFLLAPHDFPPVSTDRVQARNGTRCWGREMTQIKLDLMEFTGQSTGAGGRNNSESNE